MGRKKLTLSVEERLTQRAKVIAEERGTSVSRMVEGFFAILESGDRDGEDVSGRNGGASSGGSLDRTEDEAPDVRSLLAEYEPSAWARKWRGAFRSEGESYPDSAEWEETVLVEEIGEKHGQ